jgi:hypothetical protein
MGYLGQAPAPQVATSVGENAVDTAAIQDDAVTSAKITDGAVTPTDLSTGHPNWDSSGNVGIGTTSPATTLHVKQTNASLPALQLQHNDGDFILCEENGGTDLFKFSRAAGTNDLDINVINASNLKFLTSNTERMRIDSSGNVGIGTSNPSGLGGADINTVTNGSNSYQYVGAVNGTKTFIAYGDASQNIMGSVTSIPFIFRTNNTERMRVDSSGNLLIGRTAPGTINVVGTCIVPDGSIILERDNNQLMSLNRLNGNGTLLLFQRGAGNVVGSIVGNTSSTSYNTSSDYRLKEDVQPMSGSIDRVKTLNPVNFAWKADGSRVDGFLAHEAQEVVPEAITGTKDAMRTEDVYDEDGNVTGTQEVPDYQGIDQSKLVPLLTAALQEAITKIETLEARVATLESA